MDEFIDRALETWYEQNNPLHYNPNHPALALCEEAGEVAGLIKKHIYKPGYRLDKSKLKEELGDVLYYLRILAYQFGWTLDEIAIENYQKLTAREANGTGYNRGMEK